jgi:hypothetical protein
MTILVDIVVVNVFTVFLFFYGRRKKLPTQELHKNSLHFLKI